jgi:prolipoprotein diacylglyceryltransferase
MRIWTQLHHPLYSSLHRPPARPFLALPTFLAPFMPVGIPSIWILVGRIGVLIDAEVWGFVTRSMQFIGTIGTRRSEKVRDFNDRGTIRGFMNRQQSPSISSWVFFFFVLFVMTSCLRDIFLSFFRCHILVGHLI